MHVVSTVNAEARRLERCIRPLGGARADYDPLMELIGDTRFVLIGEASHGTHEFYLRRAELTQRLIEEKGFNAVAVEADWPDAYAVNCYVRGRSAAPDAVAALKGFERFPTWMWRNTVVRDFVAWLRAHNQRRGEDAPEVGFFGLDLYSLHASIDSVLGYLDRVDPEAAARARYRYGCFEQFGEDSQAYGYAASFHLTVSCENAVVQQLIELRQKAQEYLRRDGRIAEDDYFYAEQNARLVKSAEQYYRSMFQGRTSSWNLRDQHMADTLIALVRHLERRGRPAKVVVWAHNSHLGDARATEMGDGGELNLGQLVRERYGAESVLVGFSTYTGSVTAATDWGGAAERKIVRPGLAGSFEELFHEVAEPDFLLLMRDASAARLLRRTRLQRAIGVIYRPETERISHYFHARLPNQFDALIHLDTTRALEPLDASPQWPPDEVPETYPTGL